MHGVDVFLGGVLVFWMVWSQCGHCSLEKVVERPPWIVCGYASMIEDSILDLLVSISHFDGIDLKLSINKKPYKKDRIIYLPIRKLFY